MSNKPIFRALLKQAKANASNPNGRIFESPLETVIENIVDGNGSESGQSLLILLAAIDECYNNAEALAYLMGTAKNHAYRFAVTDREVIEYTKSLTEGEPSQ